MDRTQHFSQMSHEWIKGEGVWQIDSRSLILASCTQLLHLLSLLLSTPLPSQTPAIIHRDGVHPPILMLSLRGRPQEAEVGVRMAGVRIGWEDAVRNHVAHRHAAR
jgi:hypothetical protein